MPVEHALTITGMRCASCSGRVERTLAGIPGVESAAVNLATSSALVHSNRSVSSDQLIDTIVAAGFQARATGGDPPVDLDADAARMRDLRLRLTVALIGAVPIMTMMAMTFRSHLNQPAHTAHMAQTDSTSVWFGALSALLVIPVVFWSGWPFIASAWRNALRRTANMDTLVALGSVSAVTYSIAQVALGNMQSLYFDTAVMIITLILLGRMLEARARQRAGSAIRRLVDLAPRDATVVRDGVAVQVPIAAVTSGMLLQIAPGERIPVDAQVVEGWSTVDESMLTGEPVPADRHPGDQIYGGTVNGTGALTVRATSVGADSALAQITKLVADAQAGKARIQRLADRVSSVFVPAILVLAALTLTGWLLAGDPTQAVEAAMAVLLIACPCALGLATPAAIMVGTGRGSELGILVKGAETLERSDEIDTVVFDKTGTLTSGHLAVSEVVMLSLDDHAERTLEIIAAAEARSEHPVARAITRYAAIHAPGYPRLDVSATRAHPGAGLVSRVNGHDIVIGTRALLTSHDINIDTAPAQTDSCSAEVFAAVDGIPVARFLLRDEVRHEARDTVRTLHARGIDCILVSGDRREVAEAVAADLGIRTVIAEVRPEQKVAEISRLQAQGRHVAMVGDGLNDGAALSKADLGIAIGTGTDVAIESADIVLLNGHLGGVATALDLSRATLRTIRGNLAWAFSYNLVAVPLAIAGVLTPVIAAGAMASSSLLVLANALRLRRFRPSIAPARATSTATRSIDRAA